MAAETAEKVEDKWNSMILEMNWCIVIGAKVVRVKVVLKTLTMLLIKSLAILLTDHCKHWQINRLF